LIQTLLGKKVGMTQVFNSKGEAVPVTIVELDEGIVVNKKTPEKDGYTALQVGIFGGIKPKNVPKPLKGLFKNDKDKRDMPFKRELKEVKVTEEELKKYNIGDAVALKEMFKDGDYIDVVGTGKGKGFQGVMKRHNFHGGPGGHGSMHHRRAGSIGASSYPSRVFKNHKMAGRMGGGRVTVQNLLVEKYDADNKYMLIRGAVPGSKNSVVLMKKSIKKKQGDKK